MNQQIQMQQIYNKGLDDAETNIIKQIASLIRNNKMEELQNPQLKELQTILSEWGDYFHTQSKSLTMTGKKHKKMLDKHIQVLDNNQI
jgi:hypothetical protein